MSRALSIGRTVTMITAQKEALGGVVFHRHLHAREWTAALAMTIGLAALLYCCPPPPNP